MLHGHSDCSRALLHDTATKPPQLTRKSLGLPSFTLPRPSNFLNHNRLSNSSDVIPARAVRVRAPVMTLLTARAACGRRLGSAVLPYGPPRGIGLNNVSRLGSNALHFVGCVGFDCSAVRCEFPLACSCAAVALQSEMDS